MSKSMATVATLLPDLPIGLFSGNFLCLPQQT